MSAKRERSIQELFADNDLITKAVQKGVREAVLAHARAGNPVSELRDGKVVWVQPAEIFARYGEPVLSLPPAEANGNRSEAPTSEAG